MSYPTDPPAQGGPQFPPQYSAQFSAPQPPAPVKGKGLGIAAMILGIVAFFPAFIPILNILSFPLAIVGLVFGVIALIQARGKRGPIGFGIAGAVLSAIALIITIAMYAGAAASIDTGSSTNPPGTTQSSDTSSTASSPDAKYAVSIDGATFGTDYSGEKVIIVSYTFTNNSDSQVSFMFAIQDQAFQNGVELADAFVVDGVDSQAAMSDIKPGASITVQEAYTLKDDSTVTVECKELISFDNTMLATKDFTVQ